MTEGTTKGTRLSKAAREFNVGISTIVEFLHKKGIDIDAKPNTKINGDVYEILMQEFQSEKTVKEESKKIGLSYSKHETVSIENKSRPPISDEDDSDIDELFIKGTSVSLDDSLVVDEDEIKAKEKEKEEKKKREEEKKAAEEKKAEEKKAEEKVKAEEEKAAKEAETGKETAEKSEPPAEQEEKEEAEAEDEGPKVLGKIDLEKINQKTKPDKKARTKKEKEAEKEKEEKGKAEKEKKKEADKEKEEEKEKEKPTTAGKTEEKEAEVKNKEEAVKKEEPAAKEKEDKEKDKEERKNFIPTRVERLNGPKILDKIDLPKEPKKSEKKPVASSKDEKVDVRKKKRKRIRKEKIAKEEESKKSKEKGKGRSKRRERPKPEVSDEEIQKQIKETLARLAPTGKSKASKYRRQKREAISQNIEKEKQKAEQEASTLKLSEFVTVNDLANMMNVPVNDVISTCMQLGLFVSINQRLDAETLTLVAEEFGYSVEFVSVDLQDSPDELVEEEEEGNTTERAPIVTVMGHVDHGKTKLLDYIRKANVVAGEAGGITQHIGAYELALPNNKKITFLDTPGHEAFTAMRARGAKVTDVAIIVIAADDNVMPQTREAINHAQAAGVAIVIAINKIDKPTANPDKIKEELSKMNVLVEDWGGKYQSQEISAKQGINIDQLLEKVLLEAELLELKANPDMPAKGTVIESSLDKGRGYVAKLLVQNGTLRKGDNVLAGAHFGKVKAMYNERNQSVTEAGPSTPVLLLGLDGAPQAGDTFNVMKDEKEAKNIANKRLQLQREQGIRSQKHITLDEIGRRIAIGDFKELNLIVKGDVDGSVEALADSLLKLSTEEVQVNVIHKSVGQVTETDVMLASASNAIIVGFEVRPSLGARKLAEREEIEIRLYSIIYQAIEEIKAAIEGMLAPDIEEKITCNIEVRETFKITKVGTIAGCMVLDGKVTRNTRIRLIRDGIVVYTGKLGSLKRFKDDVKEVVAGYECGLNIENFNDVKVGDIIEGFEEVEVKRKL